MTEWRPIPSIPRFLVSDEGEVRHHRKATPRKATKVATPTGGVYYRTSFFGPTKGGVKRKAINRSIHSLVLEAFVGPCPAGQQIRHLNGDSLDNRLTNLSYGTPKENAADRDRHGRTARGERSGAAKLSASQVGTIRRLYAYARCSQRDLAKMFGVTQSSIWEIVTGNSHNYVEDLEALTGKTIEVLA